MPKPCSVCHHSKRHDIDRALMAGVSYRTLSAQFGPSPSALCRHVRHLARYVQKMQHQDEQKYVRAVLDKLELVEVRLTRVFHDAHNTKALRVALDCIKEHVKLLNSLEKYRVFHLPPE